MNIRNLIVLVYQMKISKCKSVLISFFDQIVCKLVNVWMSYLMNIDVYRFFAKKNKCIYQSPYSYFSALFSRDKTIKQRIPKWDDGLSYIVSNVMCKTSFGLLSYVIQDIYIKTCFYHLLRCVCLL